MASHRWRIRLTEAAQRDFSDIIDWTADRFGQHQARRYGDAINVAIGNLVHGPHAAGSCVEDDLPAGLRVLPIARRGVRARHVLIFRTTGDSLIEIIRILHQAMDMAKRIETE